MLPSEQCASPQCTTRAQLRSLLQKRFLRRGFGFASGFPAAGFTSCMQKENIFIRYGMIFLTRSCHPQVICRQQFQEQIAGHSPWPCTWSIPHSSANPHRTQSPGHYSRSPRSTGGKPNWNQKSPQWIQQCSIAQLPLPRHSAAVTLVVNGCSLLPQWERLGLGAGENRHKCWFMCLFSFMRVSQKVLRTQN